METIYLNRLRKLANNLYYMELKNPEVLYYADKKGNTIEHYSFAFKDLNILFEDWYNSDESKAILRQKFSVLYNACNLLGLDIDQVFHFFVPEDVNEPTTALTLANKLYEFIEKEEYKIYQPIIISSYETKK